MTQHSAETRGGLQKIRENIGVKASILLISGLAISSCTSDTPEQQSAQTYNEVYAVDDSATLDGTMCPPPNAQAIQTVEQLYKQSGVPEPTPYDPNAKIETINDIAARHGLTLHSFNDSLVNLRFDAEIENGTIPFKKYLRVMNDYTQKYGIEVVLGTKDAEITDPKDRELTAEDLNREDTKESFVNIADALSGIPEEFIRKVGVSKIVLSKIEHGTKTTENISAYVTGETPGAIYLDPTKGIYGETVRHEIFHLWAKQFCGSVDMHVDDDFTSLNPQDIYELYRFEEDKKGNPGKYISRESIENQLGSLESKAYVAMLQGKAEKKAELEKRITALKALVVVDDSYGLTEVGEDQATIGEDLLTPNGYTFLFDPQQPVLNRKAQLLQSRLYEFMPNMIEFYAEIGKTGSDAY